MCEKKWVVLYVFNSTNCDLAYLVLKLGYDPENILVVRVFVSSLALFARILFLKKLFNFSVKSYINNVIIRVLLVVIISLPISITANHIVSDWYKIITTTIIFLMTVGGSIYFIGLSMSEKKILKRLFSNFIKPS